MNYRQKISCLAVLLLSISFQLLAENKPQISLIKFKNSDPKLSIWEELYPDNQINVIAHNKWHVPMQIKIIIDDAKFVKIVPAQTKTLVTSFKANPEQLRYYDYNYFLGDPNAKVSDESYLLPFKKMRKTVVSQSFNGLISHNNDYNRYAVDVAMPQGTRIFAARSGVVLEIEKYRTKNHNFLKNNKLYNPKAANGNFVYILHDDGTIANYHHLAAGSIKVTVGQKVEAGDYIANSGNTGYSGGPHLHFMVIRNVGFNYISIPFKFDTPLKGM